MLALPKISGITNPGKWLGFRTIVKFGGVAAESDTADLTKIAIALSQSST